ncbi:nucleophile aminohydrolase [Ochromonadaceae sp. CCMP2298]|nr:nucleophile aminohydrolase [Ochromonadaceae sp. CCMP2298]KAJ1437233.1 nucleophile aminohydrolase [Ochromonadaceae sp. CCMP2298]|mmetsp:Transcript_4041/g.9082  ORF Transcript_4041/g.9082 Transcript_4041/m.9082 type:complete len:256 (-) Transcript_4041:283-1050(-)|eukprot:CAMPEP_0173187428 /NCGR_PEP_ID=MMETSP1141-20130122/10700_1 /TAXON_ID=483371 /ORGANISM="non described non described, Strain CCMP2298" /LENGTH=255 /DNA_ID=CAMNT_0014111257 /DNA_START=82 /DNA_END=849 /DNA_ORIENTATION=+
MFRNQYDTDVTVWSPQGRLHQVEYAMEAVNQGTACLGLRSKTHVVLAGLKRSPNELASFQKKLHKIDDHLGIAMSGLTADGRSLIKYMRTEALNNKYVYGAPIQGSRLVLDLADMHQRCTQSYVRRPYGVGLLVASCDQTGPHLYLTEPSGNYYEYYAMAIGSRSQTSRTYLEKEFDSFPDCSLDDLIKHALKAMAASLAGDAELDAKNASIAIVGVDQAFKVIEGPDIQRYLDAVEVEGEAEMDQEAELENPDL